MTNREMQRGVNSLASIAATAPLLGILGMLSDMPRVLNLLAYPQTYGDVAGGPAELFVLPAIGLFVASVLMALNGVLSACIDQFRMEMESSSLQLMNDLARPSTNI